MKDSRLVLNRVAFGAEIIIMPMASADSATGVMRQYSPSDDYSSEVCQVKH